MLLSAVSVLVVGQSSSEIPEGLMNNPVFTCLSFGTASVPLIYFSLIGTSVLRREGRKKNIEKNTKYTDVINLTL